MREVVLDSYAAAFGDPCVDCANITDGRFPTRILTGGTFEGATTDLYAVARTNVPAAEPNQEIGVRFAR